MGSGASCGPDFRTAYKQHLYMTAALPKEWPALMSTKQLQPEVLGQCISEDDANFFGAVSFQTGPHVKTVVSFPGVYKEDWECLVRRSVKRTGFEMHSAKAKKVSDDISTHYGAGSTSCVFLVTRKFNGAHVFKSDGSNSCRLSDQPQFKPYIPPNCFRV